MLTHLLLLCAGLMGVSGFSSSPPPLPTNATSPTLSVCLMVPTANRPEFVTRALAMMLRQDYPRELLHTVVVDDSPREHRVPDLVGGVQDVDGLAVHYVPLTEPLTIGSKRNLAARLCVGEVIVHWDDDDIYGALRLREQLAPIARGEADLTLLEHSLTYFAREDRVFAAHTATRTWGPHFGTLAYRASLHDERAGSTFPETSEAEDYGFAQRAVEYKAARVLVLPSSAAAAAALERRFLTRAEAATAAATAPEPLFVCVRHGSNTWMWDAREQQQKYRYHGRHLSSSLLHASDRAFFRAARESQLLPKLARRSNGRPAPYRRIHPTVDPNYFNHLYAPELAKRSRIGTTPVVGPRPADSSADGAPSRAAAVKRPLRSLVGAPLTTITYWDAHDPDTVAMYDLNSTSVYKGSGGVLGLAQTPLHAYGGVWTAPCAADASRTPPRRP